MPVAFQPAGYHSITPSLTVKGAARALAFYTEAFGAIEIERFPMPDGTVMHAEFKIGDSIIMLSDEFPHWNSFGPEKYGGSAGLLRIFTPDVDAAFARAVGAGAKPLMPPTDQFWGDRTCMVLDPFGHRWSMATHIEDLSVEEMKARAAKMFA